MGGEREWLVTIQGAECGPMSLADLWSFVDCHFAALRPDESLGLVVRRVAGTRWWPLVASRAQWRAAAPDAQTWRWSLMI